MAGMFEFGFGETFVVVNCTVTDELYLRNAGDGFEVGVKDRLLRTASLVVSVSIALTLRIKCLLVGCMDDQLLFQYITIKSNLCKSILLSWRENYISEEKSIILSIS